MIFFNKEFLALFFLFTPMMLKAEDTKGGMPQLDPSSFSSQIFWVSIIFFFLFLMVNFIFFPKIKNIRNERDNKINDFIKNAEIINEDAKNLRDKIDKELNKAKFDVENIINESIKRNRELFEKEIEKINYDFEKKSSQIQFDLDKRKSVIFKSISEYSYVLSNTIYEKVMDDKVLIDSKEFNKFYRQ